MGSLSWSYTGSRTIGSLAILSLKTWTMGELVEFKGYGSKVRLDDGVLTVEASNGATKTALGATTRDVPVAEITALQLKKPTLLANGQISIQSGVGVTLIHFLKKSSADAEALFQKLQDAANAPSDAVPTGKLANEKLDAWAAKLADDNARTRERMDEVRRQRRRDFEQWKSTNQVIADEWRERAANARASRAGLSSPASDESASEIAAVATILNLAEGEVTALPSSSELVDVAGDRPASEVIDELLNLAGSAGGAGDVLLEEKYILDATNYARVHGDRKERKRTTKEIMRRDIHGEVRVGSRRIGIVDSEGFLAQWSRKGTLVGVGGSDAKSIEVRSDRIIAGDTSRLIDEFTSAQVYLDGQTQVVQRPTLTRMALLSPLPGSAIIAGMALQKKTTIDTREAEFQIGSVGWQLRIRIAPGSVNSARAIAEQVNRVASSLEKQPLAASPKAGGSTESTSGAIEQLERIEYLVDRGAIDSDEAGRLRTLILDAL